MNWPRFWRWCAPAVSGLAAVLLLWWWVAAGHTFDLVAGILCLVVASVQVHDARQDDAELRRQGGER